MTDDDPFAGQGPRDVLYLLEHRLIPAVLFGDGARFLEALFHDAREPLRALWLRACGMAGSDAGIDARALACTWGRADDWHLALLRFPAPERALECHAAIIAVRVPAPGTIEGSRYFTLERSSPPESPVLCEWAQQTHINRGAMAGLSLPAFVQAVAALLGAANVNVAT